MYYNFITGKGDEMNVCLSLESLYNHAVVVVHLNYTLLVK